MVGLEELESSTNSLMVGMAGAAPTCKSFSEYIPKATALANWATGLYYIIPAFTAYPQDRYTWIPQMSSKCLMTDTQYEALISLLLSRYWEQQVVMIASGAVHDSISYLFTNYFQRV